MKRLLSALMILTFTALSANAAQQKENVLNAIQIDSLKSTYNIILNTASEVDVKRTIQSSDNMILTLRNIKPAKSLNTVYKNAAEVDSIMVEPIGSDDLNIIIKAKNISNSAVNVEPEETVEAVNSNSVIMPKKHKKSKKESIVLAAPIDSYMPVYNEDEEENTEETNFAMSGILGKIKNILSQGNNSNIITTGLIGLILFCGIKLFKKDETETAIGLTQSLKEREKDLYRTSLQNTNGLSGQISLTPQVPAASLALPQEPVAHHNNVKNNVNINSGYGLRAYKSNLRNPYMSCDNVMQNMQAKPKATQTPQPRVMSTVGSRVNNLQANNSRINLNISRPVSNTNATTAANIDSMKFLESMTKIYEKNGRSDLAQGLKAGMLKARNV